MRFPNNYGSIIKLSGKRRKPYAVRITAGNELITEDGKERVRQKYKYLGYFEKRTDAILFLSNYNAGFRVKEHRSLQKAPTFADVYKMWMDDRESRNSLSQGLKTAYGAAFNKYKDIHDKKIANIRLPDVQPILDANRDMSESTVRNMMVVIHGIYHHAKRYDFVDNDFTGLLIASGQKSKPIHSSFTEAEIKALWKRSDEPMAQYALVMIYTGMRPIEATRVSPDDINLEERYLRGGVKTEAGKDRVIPIHEKIVPIIEQKMSGPRLFKPIKAAAFKAWMSDAGMSHLPHDGRHTCATLLEAAGVPLNRRKLILGHKITDITEGTYTHLKPSDLVAEINKISV